MGRGIWLSRSLVRVQPSTTRVPAMSSCPSPQNTSQKKANWPTLSGVIVTRVVSPGTISVRTPNAGILKPWIRSIEVTRSVTCSPRFTLTVSGVKLNFIAMISTSFFDWAARRTAPPIALLPASSAMKSLRFMELGLGDRNLGDRHRLAHRDVARAERLQRGIKGRRRWTPGRVAGRCLREDQRLGRMMGNVARHVVMFLVDMAVEHDDVLVGQ